MTLKEEALQELIDEGYMTEEEAQRERESFILGMAFAMFLQVCVWLVLI